MGEKIGQGSNDQDVQLMRAPFLFNANAQKMTTWVEGFIWE